MQHKIQYARREAINAYKRAQEALDARIGDQWLHAAGMWEDLAWEYERLMKTIVTGLPE
jgi:hypothetical protein